jgi:hypothetical protein
VVAAVVVALETTATVDVNNSSIVSGLAVSVGLAVAEENSVWISRSQTQGRASIGWPPFTKHEASRSGTVGAPLIDVRQTRVRL